MKKLTFKELLKLQAWANYKAEQEGTRTFDLNIRWNRDKEYKRTLVKKWEQIALEQQEQILI